LRQQVGRVIVAVGDKKGSKVSYR
jgi:hypothetical protein